MQKRIEFDANSLLKLLVHYTMDHEDRVPLDAELISAGVSPILQRYIMLEVRSEKEWKDVPINPTTREPEIMHIRYEGNKVMSWGSDPTTHTVDAWRNSVGSPA